jgi:glycosyltransferase involved in cell wall biosynthesis
MTLLPGINVFGYVFAESGTGEHTRLLVDAIRCAGIPTAVIPYTRTGLRQNHRFDGHTTSNPIYDVNIIGINADQLPTFVRDMGQDILRGRYTIGLWAWEVDEFPTRFAASEVYVDEVWSNSYHSGFAIARAVRKPVHPFPLPIKAPIPGVAPGLSSLGLPDAFFFLFCFDFLSVFERKNPIAIVEAFRRAFPPGTGPHLVIKSVNAENAQPDFDRLRRAVADHPEIHLIDGYVDSEIQRALMARCNGYVSLHRAEGFGLTIAEALAIGKPVIATGYSGNLDFMSEKNAFLVRWRPVGVPSGCDPYPSTATWAEPDIEHAAERLQMVWRGGPEVESRCVTAQREMSELHSPERRSTLIKNRYLHARRELARRSASPPSLPVLEVQPTVPEEPTSPASSPASAPPLSESLSLIRARECLMNGPDTDAPARFGSATVMLRKLVLRSLRNYDLHNRKVLNHLMNALTELEQRIHAIESQRVPDLRPSLSLAAVQPHLDEIGNILTLFITEKESIEHHLGSLQNFIDNELLPVVGDALHHETEIARDIARRRRFDLDRQ